MKSVLALSVIALFMGMSVAYPLKNVKHPVRQEVVDRIKKNARTWTPIEVQENPLRDVPLEKLPVGGYLGLHKEDIASKLKKQGMQFL